MLTKTVKSNCHNCGYLCGFLAKVEQTDQGERLVELAPDSSRYPYSEQITNGCRRWRMNLKQLDAPDRLNYPLKRVGSRGGGKWRQVSWDEALDDIAMRLQDLAGQYGPQTLASAIGGPHASYFPLHRFLSLFGTPNNMGIGQICWNPRIWMESLTYGWPIEVHIDPDFTKQVFLWGTNPADSDNLLFWRRLRDMKRAGVPIVVIDPRKTKTAKLATLHLAPRPGTDCTLALGLIREIIAHDRIDRSFVACWCYGYEELKTHVDSYTLQRLEEVCGVNAKDVAWAAQIFSEAGATALLSGCGVDQLGTNTAPTHRALAILRAITGDVDREGACLIESTSDFAAELDLEMSDMLSVEQRNTQLNLNHFDLQSYAGYDGVTTITSRAQKQLPMRYLTSAHPQLVWQAATTHDPYRVSALICMAANPLLTYANTKLVHKAIHAMDLVVVLEQYMTPTAQLADYVLPVAGAFEKPLMQAHGGVANFCYGGDAAVSPYHERRSDFDVFRELGLRLGQEQHWPHASLKAELEACLAAAKVSWQDWQEYGIYAPKAKFNKHEDTIEDGLQRGFSTSTGKIELANVYLESLGSTRLPEPECLQSDEIFSLTLITGARTQPYWASSFFNNPEFRQMHPNPTVQLSATTLKALGAKEGQWILVETKEGAAYFITEVADIVDGVLSVEYGWWYPESEADEPNLSGIWQSNANILTGCDIKKCEPLIGTWVYNGIACKTTTLPNDFTPPFATTLKDVHNKQDVPDK